MGGSRKLKILSAFNGNEFFEVMDNLILHEIS